MESYYQKHKDEILKYQRKYRQEHKSEIAEYHRKYSEEHKDEINEHHRGYQRKYRQRHKDEILKYQRKYYQGHKDETKEYQRNRKLERPYKKLGYFLTRRLNELNKNQSWLAEQIEVSRESVSKYSAGVSFPKAKLRRRLCKALEISISDLEKIIENQNG